MTPAQINKAEQLLAKKKEMLTLTDRYRSERGYITNHLGEPILHINNAMDISLETLEKWIKQAKTAAKMGII
jgi:hypothetical protein